MNELQTYLASKIKMQEIEPGVFGLVYPLYKEDGKPYSIFVNKEKNDTFTLTDRGTTLEELDKIFMLDEPEVYKSILAVCEKYKCTRVGKAITINASAKNLHLAISNFVQALSFLLNMKIFYV